MPTVSVCLPICDRIAYLQDAIESILNQTYTDFELIISDGSVSNDCYQLVQTYTQKDSRIKYFRNKKYLQKNVHYNYNNALQYSSGNYINLFNDDDVMYPDYLGKAVTILEKYPEVGLFSGSAQFVDENLIPLSNNKIHQHPVSFCCHGRDWILENLGQQGAISTPFVVFRKTTLQQVGGEFNCEYQYKGDWELFLKMATHSSIYLSQEICGKYRVHQQSLTTQINHQQKLKELAKLWSNILDYLNLPPEELVKAEKKTLSNLSGLCADWVLHAIQNNNSQQALDLCQILANWRGKTIHIKPLVQCLGGEIQELRGWIEELQQSKDWLEGELQQSKNWLEGELQNQQEWIEELQQGKNWLEGELNASVTYAQSLEKELASAKSELNQIKNSKFFTLYTYWNKIQKSFKRPNA